VKWRGGKVPYGGRNSAQGRKGKLHTEGGTFSEGVTQREGRNNVEKGIPFYGSGGIEKKGLVGDGAHYEEWSVSANVEGEKTSTGQKMDRGGGQMKGKRSSPSTRLGREGRLTAGEGGISMSLYRVMH